MAVHQAQKEADCTRRPAANWQRALPALTDGVVTLRSLRASDAPALCQEIGTPAVLRYLNDSPRSPEEFRRFIRWTQTQRRRGLHLCFGVIPQAGAQPAGIFQIWSVDCCFATAEWGFVIAEAHWGSGLFDRASRLLLDFAFQQLHVQRLEARAALANGRGNGALRKLAATPEGILRSALKPRGAAGDSMMWSILASDWSRSS